MPVTKRLELVNLASSTVPDPILLALILVKLAPDPLNVPAVTVFEKAL